MALANRASTSRVGEYQNSAIADPNYENDNQMFRMNDKSNYEGIKTNGIHIYQNLAPSRQIEFTNGPLNESDQVLLSGMVRLSFQEKSQPRISHGYEETTATKDETPGEQQRSHPHLFCDSRFCRRDKKVWLIIFFTILSLILSVLVILFITRNIGLQLEDKIMMQETNHSTGDKKGGMCFDELNNYTRRCNNGWTGENFTTVKKNCAEIYSCGLKMSGVYKINPDGKGAFDVFCDQKTAGGGWTVFQKRLDGLVNFFRGWNEYKIGFGHLKGEYWLGLAKIYRLTQAQRYKLRVDLEDTMAKTAYAEYGYFGVSSEHAQYKLSLGNYSGTAGDSLSYHRGMPFSTKDRDNDHNGGNCASKAKGAWWYKNCDQSNLNGWYHYGAHKHSSGITWRSWKGPYYSAKIAEMKLRPVGFIPK